MQKLLPLFSSLIDQLWLLYFPENQFSTRPFYGKKHPDLCLLFFFLSISTPVTAVSAAAVRLKLPYHESKK